MSFSQYQNKSPNFDMTNQEIKQVQNAMKNKEFVNLLKDYMDEISDPKNKEEYDQYLKQLEKDQELPKELKLLEPVKGFCVKSTIKSKNKSRNLEQKLFINICSSDEIQQPSCENDEKNGQKGQNWKIPYILGKVRLDQDREFMEKQQNQVRNQNQSQVQNKKIQVLKEEEFAEKENEQMEEKLDSIEAPKYKIVESYFTIYEDFIDKREMKENKRPKNLSLDINLPKIEKFSELTLDINNQNLVLEAKDKYYLDIKLPYVVNQEEGSAKFESKSKVLKIVLPINQAFYQDQLKSKEKEESIRETQEAEGQIRGNAQMGDIHPNGHEKELDESREQAQLLNNHDIAMNALEFQEDLNVLQIIDQSEL